MNIFLSFLVGACLAISQADAAVQLEARHQPTGLNTLFNGDKLSFPDYVERSRAMIAKTHAGVGVTELEKIVDGNAPFELMPAASCTAGKDKIYRRGVLLTHGLTDSPYFMRDLAAFFQKNCFRVMAILLPGHGTRPGDLLDVSWREWAKAEAYGTDRLAAEVDEVYLAGFSTGGALSVYQGLRDKRIRGLFLFSPAFKVSWKGAVANLHKIYSWAFPAAKWLDIMPDKDLYKYESFPKNAGAQIYALTRKIHAQLQDQGISVPVFAAASMDDATVDTSATVEFMTHAGNPTSKLVLYTTEPANAPQDVPAVKLEMVNSVFPDQKILSSAHTAIVLLPDDKHYGAAGDYSNCIHYYPDEMEKYKSCNNHPGEDFQGELTEQNLKVGILRRLMYNPNFPALELSMKKFIDSLQ